MVFEEFQNILLLLTFSFWPNIAKQVLWERRLDVSTNISTANVPIHHPTKYLLFHQDLCPHHKIIALVVSVPLWLCLIDLYPYQTKPPEKVGYWHQQWWQLTVFFKYYKTQSQWHLNTRYKYYNYPSLAEGPSIYVPTESFNTNNIIEILSIWKGVYLFSNWQ